MVLVFQNLSEELSEIHEKNTSYKLLKRSYSQVKVSVAPFEDAHWDNIISGISKHVDTVTQKRKDNLLAIVTKVGAHATKKDGMCPVLPAEITGLALFAHERINADTGLSYRLI